MNTGSTKGSHSEDVSNLLSQYKKGLKSYHEIRLQDSIGEIRTRWPLLNEINNSREKE